MCTESLFDVITLLVGLLSVPRIDLIILGVTKPLVGAWLHTLANLKNAGNWAPEMGLSGKGVVTWCLLTSQGTTTSNRKNCSSHYSTWRGQHSDVFTPFIVELKHFITKCQNNYLNQWTALINAQPYRSLT